MTAIGAAILLGDIGGTNARFALLSGGEIGPVSTLPVAGFADPRGAIAAFLETVPDHMAPTAAVLAVAGPVRGGRAALTNGVWRFEADRLGAALGLGRVRLVNDFEAQAWALPALEDADRQSVGGGTAVREAPLAVLGPGTGLGVAGLVPRDGTWQALVTEGGHVTMAPTDARESRILDHLRAGGGHVSAERVISGPGLVNLYRAMAALDGEPGPADDDERDLLQDLAAHFGTAPGLPADTLAALEQQADERGFPARIMDLAMGRPESLAAAAFETFCAMLGTVAGNLALTLGAQGGVYIGGGILRRVPDAFAASPFRARFEAKGRFQSYLAEIPTWLITHPSPAMAGLRALVLHDG